MRGSNRPVIGFYTAIGYAYTPHAILARWLGLPKDPPENTDLPPEVELAAGRDPKVRFGLMPHCVGRGLGRYLLYSAIEQAWSYEPERLTVNTNTMDHPRALPLYQRMGFVPYRQEEQEIIDPEISGIIPA